MTLKRFACKMRSPMLTRSTLVLLACLVVPAVSSCGGPLTPGGLVIYTTDAPELAMASIDPETGSWQSAPWSAGDTGWLPYPPRGQLMLEHNLGRTPQTVLVYLAFERDGDSPALAAGNLARVVDADPSTVTVWNDTNGTYFARIVAQ